MTESIPLILFLVAVLAVAFFVVWIRANAKADDGASMPMSQRGVLIGYMLLLVTLLAYMLISLNSVNFPDTAALPQPVALPSPSPSPSPSPGTGGAGATATPTPSPSPSPTVQPPALYRVIPQTSTSSPPTVSLTLYGKNFKRESKIRFNAVDVPTDFIADDLITAQLEPVHLVNVGAVTVDVDNKNGLLSNAISVPVMRPMAPLNVFFLLHPWITRDIQLLLLAIFAGALGSIFHALKSLGDFIGNRTVLASWYWWYVMRPFLGVALALIFYAVLRGGFVVGSPADAKVVNPFGVLAIGALVGMFADKAAQKLAEVFDVVFRAADQRGGKLDAPVIDRVEPGTLTTGDTKPLIIKIIGDRLGKVVTVRLNSQERKPDTVTEKEITLKLNPDDVKTSGVIKVSVVNPDGGTSAAATLHVSDLAITTTALPDAKVGTDYRQTMTVSGGTPPYKWSLINPPKWLTIVEGSGELQGKPEATDAKDTTVTVKVVDKDTANASKTLTLKVNP
jgi:Putative Ig domain